MNQWHFVDEHMQDRQWLRRGQLQVRRRVFINTVQLRRGLQLKLSCVQRRLQVRGQQLLGELRGRVLRRQ